MRSNSVKQAPIPENFDENWGAPVRAASASARLIGAGTSAKRDRKAAQNRSKTTGYLVNRSRLKTRRRDQEIVVQMRRETQAGKWFESRDATCTPALSAGASTSHSSRELESPTSHPTAPTYQPLVTPINQTPSSFTDTQNKNRLKENKNEENPKNSTRAKISNAAPTWKNTTEVARLHALSLASQAPEQTPAGEATARAITVNLGDDVVSAAHASGAFCSHLQRRLSQHLKLKLGRKANFWAALEISPTGQLHVHGVVIAAEQELQPLRDALKSFGGVWREGRTRGRQVDIRPAHDLPGWAKYASKMSARKVRNYLNENALAGVRSRQQEIIFASAPLKARAKEAWDSARAALNASRAEPHQNELELSHDAPKSIVAPAVEIKTPEASAMPTSGTPNSVLALFRAARKRRLEEEARRLAARALEAKPITALLSTAPPKESDPLSFGAAPPHSP